MLNYVATIADNNISGEVGDFCRSIMVGGYLGDVFIFTPSNNPIQDAPVNSRVIRFEANWDDNLGKDNIAASFKPQIFTWEGFEDRSKIVYLDSSDLLVFCDIDEIFDKLGDGKILAAKNYKTNRAEEYRDKLRDRLDISDDIILKCKTVSSGVIVGRKGAVLTEMMHTWDTMIQDSGYHIKLARGKIGDQISFNFIFAHLHRRGLTNYLSETYNFSHYIRTNKLRIKDRKPVTKDGSVVKVLHGSGSGNIDSRFRELVR